MQRTLGRAKRPARERDAETAREALLDAAQEIFARDGFSGARVDDIAQRAGYNKALAFVTSLRTATVPYACNVDTIGIGCVAELHPLSATTRAGTTDTICKSLRNLRNLSRCMWHSW